MTRLVNRAGVVVSVSSETATRLGPDWSPEGSTGPDASWTVKQMREYADAHDIDVDGLTKKADVLAAISQ